MRIFIVLMLATALFGCDKKELDSATPIVGDWELRRSQGGVAGLIVYNPGNGNILQFKNNGNYKRIANGTANETGTYTLEPSPTVQGHWQLTMISSNGSIVIFRTKVENSELVLLKQQDCCDFPDMTYERI